MARRLAKAAAVALVLLAFAAAAGRYAVGALTASDGFRETAARQLEKAIRPFVPQALISVEESELVGIASVVLRRLTIRSEQKIDAVVTVQELRVQPRWVTVFWPGPTEFGATMRLAGDGAATLSLAVPLRAVLRSKAGDDAAVEMTGSFTKGDAPSLTALVLASGRGRAPRLAQGLVDGEFALSKSVGDERAAGKIGHTTLRFYDVAYALPDREEKLSPFAIVLNLHDYTARIVQPLVIESQSHDSRAIVVGALLLPHRAEQNLRWELDLTADGRPGFKDDLAQVFRCQAPPSGPRFRIVGPVADAHCQAIAAGAKRPVDKGH